jgi:hypothetical protein
VSIQATDLGGNATNNLTKVTDEKVAAASISADGKTVTLANGAIGDLDFDGDVDASDITALTQGTTSIAGAITGVNPSLGTITLGESTLATTTATVKVTYHYAPDAFEVDRSAPTVTFDPADGTTIQNQNPFLKIEFDEDEYSGDGFKTVTLTKAEITNPDATTSDALANFATTDNITYIWAASGLALGDYTLVVSGEDAAGNKLVDATATFTIAARAKYSVALRPGWNLVSIPDDPSDTAIDTVITVTDVDAVLSYDAPQGVWLTATRGPDGTFEGNLTTIEANKAYWVHTATFDPILVDIPAADPSLAALPPAIPVVVGWNLLPIVSLDIATLAISADDYLSSVSWTRAYSFDTPTNSFQGLLPSPLVRLDLTLTIGTTIDPYTGVVATVAGVDEPVIVGKGYWVYVTETGVLVP